MQSNFIDWDSDELNADIAPVTRQAVTWFGVMHSDEVTPAARDDFIAWLKQSPEHARAYDEIERVWRAAEVLPELEQAQRVRRRITRRALLAGGIGLIGGGATLGWLSTHPFADLRTGTAERLTAELADGSMVELASRTALELRFTAASRSIRLFDGEAYFTVAPEAARPFSVLAGDGRVTALGTAFSVARSGGEVAVTVAEHGVEVDLRGDRRRVDAGRQLVYRDAFGATTAIDPASALAWRDGRLVFVSQPFGRVVEALNRWRDGTIIVADAGLQSRLVTVIVELERTGTDLLGQLEAALPIRSLNLGPLLAVIYAT